VLVVLDVFLVCESSFYLKIRFILSYWFIPTCYFNSYSFQFILYMLTSLEMRSVLFSFYLFFIILFIENNLKY